MDFSVHNGNREIYVTSFNTLVMDLLLLKKVIAEYRPLV